MSEQVLGMGMTDSVAARDAVMAQPRPRIGADKFRALADRLRKPAVADAQVAIPDLMPAAPVHVEPVWVAPEPVLPLPVPEPVVEHVAAPIEDIEHQPQPVALEYDSVVAEASDIAAVDEEAPSPAFDTQPVEFAVEHIPAEPVHAGSAVDELVAPVPVEAAPELATTAPTPFPEPAVTSAPEEIKVEALQFDVAEVAVVADTIAEAHPALPAFEELASPAPAQHSFESHPALSPLERVLSHHAEPVVVERALPEILPPPEPPPEPKPLPKIEGVELAAPSMEEVQERLREDASNRMQQLDIENIWRQVLASPTLEERADYLREAAEIMILEGVVAAPTIDIAPEHDLSRIAPVAQETQLSAVEDDGADAYLVMENALQARADAEQLETAELARSLMDMMASGSNSGLPHERALAADTLLRLLPKLAVKPLAMLAQRLAMMDNPPQLLVARLIRDERIDVSGPLLEDCMHITDHDLSMVFAEDNMDKLRMIARRRKLSRAIADQLIATEDPSVLLTLVRNSAAEISHDGFYRLICLAAEMPDIMAPLSTRNDLSAPSAFQLFWAVPAQLRRYLLHRFLTDSETLTKILKITLSTGDAEDVKEAKPSTVGEITEYLELACRGKLETASVKLASSLGVEPATIERILLDREGEGMVVMLKAAAYPRSNMGDLLKALQRGEVTVLSPERDVSELQSMFDTLSNNKARILLTYWDWAVKKSGPYAPVN